MIIGLSALAFMNMIHFLPGAPIFPLLVSILLFFTALYKGPRWSSGILAMIVFVSILYQITGFMVWTRIEAGWLPLLLAVALLFNLFSAHKEATSMAIAVLAVAVMFTPYYYLSVAFIVAAAVIGGLSSIGPVSITYVITMAPLLLIENAFISGGSAQPAIDTPMLFGQLVNFAANMRPPIPGLNFFLTRYPSNFFDPTVAAPVVTYLSGKTSFLLLVPLVILLIVFLSSAGIAGVINGLLDKLTVFGKTSRLLKVISPLLASIVTPLTFFILITSLSSKSIGGYDTSLSADPMVSMIMTSLTLGAVFTAREYGIQWLERTERARIAVIERLGVIEGLIKSNKEIVAEATAEASSISFTLESKIIEETESSIGDITKGLSTARYQTLTHWLEELDDVLAPKMNNLPETIRVKIVGELNLFKSLVVTYNNSLNEAGLSEKFSESTESKADTDFNQALREYSRITEEIKTSSNAIFERYKETYNAFNVITSKPDMLPPVDPNSLFESNDFDGGVKLLAEEYWLNFQVKNSSELNDLVNPLLESCRSIVSQLDDRFSVSISSIAERLRNPTPVNSIVIRDEVTSLKFALAGIITVVETEISQLGKILESFPGASKVISFRVFQQSKKLESIKQRNLATGPTLRDTARMIEEATILIKSYRENRRVDEENLIIVSQIPIAMKIIENRLATKKAIRISDIPFKLKAAQTYAALYANNHPEMKYDDDEEVITRKCLAVQTAK